MVVEYAYLCMCSLAWLVGKAGMLSPRTRNMANTDTELSEQVLRKGSLCGRHGTEFRAGRLLYVSVWSTGMIRFGGSEAVPALRFRTSAVRRSRMN